MFGELTSVLGAIKSTLSGAASALSFKNARDRRNAVVGLLEVYFLIKDCTEEAETLVADVKPNPVTTISSLEPDQAMAKIRQWDTAIRRQGIRLVQLQERLLGQNSLAVIDPDLEERLREIVGNKMDRAESLHGIGAALFFYNMFPVADTAEEKARYVALMVGEEGTSLDMERISNEIYTLREVLEGYRQLVLNMAGRDEVLALSDKAREITKMQEIP